jgi:hypothetical protein
MHPCRRKWSGCLPGGLQGNPQKLNPVMAIISFFPMDDPSMPVIQFIIASRLKGCQIF